MTLTYAACDVDCEYTLLCFVGSWAKNWGNLVALFSSVFVWEEYLEFLLIFQGMSIVCKLISSFTQAMPTEGQLQPSPEEQRWALGWFWRNGHTWYCKTMWRTLPKTRIISPKHSHYPKNDCKTIYTIYTSLSGSLSILTQPLPSLSGVNKRVRHWMASRRDGLKVRCSSFLAYWCLHLCPMCAFEYYFECSFSEMSIQPVLWRQAYGKQGIP